MSFKRDPVSTDPQYHAGATMSKADKTLRRVFEYPAPANLRWSGIEALLKSVGAEVSDGSGSRVRVALNGVRAVLHRPHPNPEATRPQVRAVRTLLENAGVTPAPGSKP